MGGAGGEEGAGVAPAEPEDAEGARDVDKEDGGEE